MIVGSYHVIHRPYDQHWARHSLGDASQQCAQTTRPDSARVPLGLALVGFPGTLSFYSQDLLIQEHSNHTRLPDTRSHSPKGSREALTKFEQMANWPEIIGCPFLRIASEYPDTAHPYHRLAIEHQNKILDYLTDLLKPFAIDKRAATAILSVIDQSLPPGATDPGHSNSTFLRMARNPSD